MNHPAANVSSTAYNVNNQLTSWGGATHVYDNNGNLTSGSGITYAWNARNQLTGMSGAVTASFSYDGLGRRIGKTVGGVTTGYVYDGLNFVQEKNGTGATATPTANLITGLGYDETFTRMTGTGASAALSHFLPDANNNTIRLLNAAQTVTDTYTYEPYGKTIRTGTSGNTQRYTGREEDATGLYYYRARYYNPTMSRFISEDPIEFAAGPNLYAYVSGDPVNRVDPMGELPVFVVPAIVIGATAYAGYEGYQASKEFTRLQCLSRSGDGNNRGDDSTPGQGGVNPTVRNAGRAYWDSFLPTFTATLISAASTRGLAGAGAAVGGYAVGALGGLFQECPCP